jgi:hypothetical protein
MGFNKVRHEIYFCWPLEITRMVFIYPVMSLEETKVFSEVDGPVSHSAEVVVNTQPTYNTHSATGASHGR